MLIPLWSIKTMRLPRTSRRPFYFIAHAKANNKSPDSNYLWIEKQDITLTNKPHFINILSLSHKSITKRPVLKKRMSYLTYSSDHLSSAPSPPSTVRLSPKIGSRRRRHNGGRDLNSRQNRGTLGPAENSQRTCCSGYCT